MTPGEHYAEADRLLGEYGQASADARRVDPEIAQKLDMAQVHALLALAPEDFRPRSDARCQA